MVPDQHIADQAGVSRTLVVNYRKKLGIPAYQGHKNPPAAAAPAAAEARPFRGRRSALDPYLPMLGKVPDSEIARLARVTAENVRTYRQRRHIAAIWHEEGAVPAAPAAPIQPEVAAKPAAESTKRPSAPAPKERPAPAASAPPPPAAKATATSALTAPAVSESAALAPASVTGASVGPASADTTAFLVVVDTDQGPRSYALLAADIASAATVAQARVAARHPEGTIRTLQRVAEVLS
jgi:hypothetical protein